MICFEDYLWGFKIWCKNLWGYEAKGPFCRFFPLVHNYSAYQALQFYNFSTSEESVADDEESSIILVASWLQIKELLVSKGVFASWGGILSLLWIGPCHFD